MAAKLVSGARRPVHLGPYRLERLLRGRARPEGPVPRIAAPVFRRPEAPAFIGNAMADYQALMDALRDGQINAARADCPTDPDERSQHLKAFGYFCDASLVGVTDLTGGDHLAERVENAEVGALLDRIETGQTRTLASGIDTLLAELRGSLARRGDDIAHHGQALVLLYEMPRDPRPDEAGTDWIAGAQEARAGLRAAETAVVLASYLRLLGFSARAHTQTAADVDLGRLAVGAGLAQVEGDALVAPFLGPRFGIAAVTTAMELTPDGALASGQRLPRRPRDPYARRRYVDGPYPFERLKRVDRPTTYIDEPNVPRVPKRTDMFARALFGDMGPALQDGAKGGYFVAKSPVAKAQRLALGALTLLQDGAADPEGPRPADPAANAAAIKATAYFLGCDAVGVSRCPEWVWYSHDAGGQPIEPPHDQAISIVIDQGYETMEGASGDDWISVAQSMRAYLRFSILGGVLAQQIRNLGFEATAHTAMAGEVLQPPLLLLAGLGEVSRIGEVILNPFLGPRLKSGVITTDMPLAHDRPIDFGLQAFCEACNKCARECPSGAITAGPKRMFNGYEIWKSDSQKCATYRITTEGGAMCGRCMKTCPWNLEGTLAERPFHWAAMHLPGSARALARLDDMVGNGGLNPVKKWWWDLALSKDGAYRTAKAPVNARDLQRELDIRHEDQTLAVYPAPLAPHPWPYPYPMDREAGIAAYGQMIGADDYRAARAAGETGPWDHRYSNDTGSPVIETVVAAVEPLSDAVTKYTFQRPDGADLPPWTAGAHIDVVVAPEYLRQFSLSGDPADRSRYEIGVLREDAGRGGSRLMHQAFHPGRRVFLSPPINHFPLVEGAAMSVLMGGGIGVTPLIAMAHRLHATGAKFALHYSVRTRAEVAYWDEIARGPWADRATLHVSDEGTRADLAGLLGSYEPGWHVYTCGPDRYMNSVLQAAENAGFEEDEQHLEYFSVPDAPTRENHPFTLRLARSGRDVPVAADQSATDALAAAGVHVPVKCSDGLCGVCQCKVLGGAVDHRDYVLAAAERETSMILCQSRAETSGGVIEIDL